jgi:transcriptional regulator with XRE-family HTH domain
MNNQPSVPQPDPDSQRTEFGRQIRAQRKNRGWTLTQLSERTGLAISTLSKVERGLMALTFDRLAQLADGLDVDMASLFAADGKSFESGSFSIARKGDFQRQETANYVYEMLFPEVWNKAMTPMMGTLKANDIVQFEGFIRHPGQEFLTVLSGQVTVHTDIRPPVTLEVGDSVYFDSEIGHLYATTGSEPARILVVCAAPPARRFQDR